jgi:DNA damage-binding protein 1
LIVPLYRSSVSVLEYDPASHTLTETLRDLNANWMTALEPAGDGVWLGAEHMNNLLTLARPGKGTGGGSGSSSKLEVVGEFHLGDFVNRFRPGSLATLPPSPANKPFPPSGIAGTAAPAAADADAAAGAAGVGPSLLFGTVGGSVGTVTSLSEVEYHLFVGLQRAVTKVRDRRFKRAVSKERSTRAHK